MSDQRLGSALRAVRIKRRWRQKDLAERAGVSPAYVSLVERGHIATVTIDGLRRVGAVLDVRIDLVARWRGGELDRLINARHAALTEVATRLLRDLGWEVAPEVSFSIYRESGSIDLLAWHPPSRTLLVVEIKTEVVDLQDLIGTLDRKTRLAPEIARKRGWDPLAVGTWLVVGESTANRTRVRSHSALFGAAFATRRREMDAWLRAPAGRASALSFLRYSTPGNAKSGSSGSQRVRVPSRTKAERA